MKSILFALVAAALAALAPAAGHARSVSVPNPQEWYCHTPRECERMTERNLRISPSEARRLYGTITVATPHGADLQVVRRGHFMPAVERAGGFLRHRVLRARPRQIARVKTGTPAASSLPTKPAPETAPELLQLSHEVESLATKVAALEPLAGQVKDFKTRLGGADMAIAGLKSENEKLRQLVHAQTAALDSSLADRTYFWIAMATIAFLAVCAIIGLILAAVFFRRNYHAMVAASANAIAERVIVLSARDTQGPPAYASWQPIRFEVIQSGSAKRIGFDADIAASRENDGTAVFQGYGPWDLDTATPQQGARLVEIGSSARGSESIEPTGRHFTELFRDALTGIRPKDRSLVRLRAWLSELGYRLDPNHPITVRPAARSERPARAA